MCYSTLSFTGHFCTLTSNPASISSTGVLPSGCAKPNYMLDAQPILQLQVHTSQTKIFLNLCRNHDNPGVTSLVTLKTRVWITHKKVFIHSSLFIWPMLLITKWTISHNGRQRSAQHYFALRWGPCRSMYGKLFPSAHRHVTHTKHVVHCIWKFCWWDWQHFILNFFFKTLQCNDLYHI